MKSRSYKTELLLIALTVFCVGFMLILNDVNIFVRVKELKIFLQKSNKSNNDPNHMALLMKYKIHKELYENKANFKDVDLVEMRVNSLLKDSSYNKNIKIEKYDYLSRPVVAVINFFRLLIGKSPIKNISETKSNVYLEVSYYYERNNYYKKALEVYAKALQAEKYDRKVMASIVLHQGFCYAIIGDYADAKKKYLTLIKDFDNDELAIIAATLLRYMEGFQSEVERILKFEKDSIDKGEKLYNIIAYKEALNVLKKIENKIPDAKKSRLRFLQAKCMEGLAKKEEAVNAYQQIIMQDSRSEYAKSANRRLFIIGSVAANGEKVKQLAQKNNVLLKDPAFDKMTEEATRIGLKSDNVNKEEINKFYRQVFKEYKEDKVLIANDIYKSFITELDKKIEKSNVQEIRTNPTPRSVKIYTTDGNIFIGTIKRYTTEHIILQTSIGEVPIERKRILRKE